MEAIDFEKTSYYKNHSDASEKLVREVYENNIELLREYPVQYSDAQLKHKKFTEETFEQLVNEKNEYEQITAVFHQFNKINQLNNLDIMHSKIADYDYYVVSKERPATIYHSAWTKIYCWVVTKQSDYGELIYACRYMHKKRQVESLLLWLKSYLNKNFIFNSEDTWAKNLANSGKFKMLWLNIKTGDKCPSHYLLESTEDWWLFVE